MTTESNPIGRIKVNGVFDDACGEVLEDVMDTLEVPNIDDDEIEQRQEIEGLAGFVCDCFKKSEEARIHIEDRWVNALRQYKGVYSDDILAKISPNKARAFKKITYNKVNTLTSRLSDLLFPSNGDKNWSISPTPIPQLNDKKIKAILEIYYQDTGEIISSSDLQVMMGNVAKEQATKMELVIEDQLAELKYNQIMRDVLKSGHIYGTGILKGPLVTISENRQYYKKSKVDGKDKWILQEFDSITPFIEHVRVWDIYPDMDSVSLSDARYIIQRRKMDKHQVLGLAKRSDFDAEVITGYLAEHSSGDYAKKSFETTLSSLGDRNFVSTEVFGDGDAGTGVYSSGGQGYTDTEKKYELLEFWGYVDADDLINIGVDIPEDKKGVVELFANVWVLGDKVVKASLSPMDGVCWPYFFYYYSKDETSVFGEGIPDVIKDDQAIINSALRMILDNAAISSGPQMEVNLSLLAGLEDVQDIYPFKIWPRTGEGQDAANRAVNIMTFPNYTGPLSQIMEIGQAGADESSSIPKYMWGEGSGNVARTASGLSMLMGSANIAIKDQVKNFDEGVTKPFITAMYYWNMQFNEDEDIKGDYGIQAQGSTSLISKEVLSERLMQFAQIAASPMFASITHAAPLFREIAKVLDFDDMGFVMSDQEIQAQQQQQQMEAEAMREQNNMITEMAREYGVSPQSMADTYTKLRREYQEPFPTSGNSPASMLGQMQAQEATSGPL